MPKISGFGLGDVQKISGLGLGQVQKVSGLGLGLIWTAAVPGRKFVDDFEGLPGLDTDWAASGTSYGLSWNNWTKFVGARNGTTSHTIPFTQHGGAGGVWTAPAGNTLFCIVFGAVTHTEASGTWTKRIAATLSGELAVFTKTAAGGENSITLNHNGSDYPIVGIIYDLGSATYITASQNSNTTATFSAVTPLGSGTKQVFAAIGAITTGGTTKGDGTVVAPWYENIDWTVPDAATDGAWLAVEFQYNVPTGTTTLTPSFSAIAAPSSAATDREKVGIAFTDPGLRVDYPIADIHRGQAQFLGTTAGDVDLYHTIPMETDDMVVRFSAALATSTVNTWFSAPILRAASDKSSFVSANFAYNGLYMQNRIDGAVPTDWKSLATSAANIAANTIVEISAIGNKYAIVYETVAGVRSEPVTPYVDTGNAYGYGPSKRHVGLRLGRGGTNVNSSPAEKFEAYDTSVWPIHVGLTKNASTQSLVSLNSWQTIAGFVARPGYPHSIPASNKLTATGSGTVTINATVAFTIATSRTFTIRLKKNGTVIWTAASAVSATSIAMPAQTGITVAAGDYFEIEAQQNTGTITTIPASTTFFTLTPTAPGV